jgi:hypothetical protein
MIKGIITFIIGTAIACLSYQINTTVLKNFPIFIFITTYWFGAFAAVLIDRIVYKDKV